LACRTTAFICAVVAPFLISAIIMPFDDTAILRFCPAFSWTFQPRYGKLNWSKVEFS